uniref:Ig-like domain-containing protein n=1 Tax=Sinocyclocheilus rhinocerous TaxID=307959 RepID=A0A673IA02_9TELE
IGQRLVQIQEGPLYRVKGYPIAISCNVTGFKGPAKQDFQFIVKKPNVDINMISTSSSVLLWIKHLLEEDAGDLLCETPNTDAVYFGNYTAETKLNVIADTLEACYSGSPSQSLSEGDPLQLEYQVSSQTFQHTHLSVTWFLHGEEDENPRPIITLDKDLTVKPGAGFEDHYRVGLISMDKVEDTTYRLKMPQVQQSDQGKFYCKAIEWIQDPDRSWTQIAYKTTTLSIHVDTKEKQKEDSFAMDRTDKNLDINEGDQFDLECSLDVGKEDPTHHYENQQLKDRLRFSRPTSDTFHLAVLNSDTADSGSYQCRVEQYQLDCKGQWKQTAHAQSGSTIVTVCSIGNTSIYISFTLITIFTARHDGILHSAISDKYLVFGRPSVTHYKLTVPQISPTDMGQYYCQVEEWLLTATIWKKLASDKSGELTIYVHTEGNYPERSMSQFIELFLNELMILIRCVQ